MSDTDLTKSKIININDFIFRQNLEFYPNLFGLTCIDNNLTYEINGEIVASETLTFDLRTLPGNIWNVNPNEFMNIIKINKICKKLIEFSEILSNPNIDNIITNKEALENQITNYMKLYFNVKDSFDNLSEDNKMLISHIEILIASLVKETLIGKLVNDKLDDYFETTKTIGDQKGKEIALVLKNKNLPSLIEEEPITYKKAGFINIAIIIYSILNIGFIIAVAMMK